MGSRVNYGHPINQGFWIEGTWVRLSNGNVQLSRDGKTWSMVYESRTNPLESLFIGWVPP